MAWFLTTGTRVTPKAAPTDPAPLPMILPQRRALADFFPDNPTGAGTITEFEQAGLHCYANGNRGFYRVKAHIVHQVIGFGNVVEIVHTAVCTHGPDRFIFKSCRLEVFILVIVYLGTLDNAAGVTIVLWLAAAFLDDVIHGFAGNFIVSVKLAQRKVFGRQGAGFIDDIYQRIGSISGKGLAYRVVDQGLGKGPVGRFKIPLVWLFVPCCLPGRR